MNGFARKNGNVVAVLSQQEAAVIRGLVSQIKDMLAARADETPRDELAEITGIRAGPSTPPEDQVVGRLLPDFYRRDPETGETDEEETGAAGAMRSLHEPELIEAKTYLQAVPYFDRLDHLAVELQHEAQDAVRRRMLWAEVDREVADVVLGHCRPSCAAKNSATTCSPVLRRRSPAKA